MRYFLVLLVMVCLGASAFAEETPKMLNVLDFGAIANYGTAEATDNTAAFQAALDAAREKGSEVYVPGGHYLFRGHLTVPQGVTLRGTWNAPPGRETGSVLLPTEGKGVEDGPPFITLEGGCCVSGLVITYPEQVVATVPPFAYPWTIQGRGPDCQVVNCLIVRSWQMLDFGTYPCGRFFIDGIYGSALRRGIYIDGSVDVGRVRNVQYVTFFFPYQGELDLWKRANCEAFIIGKADWVWFENCFALGVHVGFRFLEGKGGNEKRTGPPNYIALTRCGIDESEYNMVVENSSGITASQCVFKGWGIDIEPTNQGPLKFSQCWFSPMPGTSSLFRAHGMGRISFMDCTFEFWDTQGDLSPALLADCPSVSVIGCEFGTHNRTPYFIGDHQKYQIHLTERVQSAVITGNRFRYGESLLNESKGQVALEQNVVDNFDAWDEAPPGE